MRSTKLLLVSSRRPTTGVSDLWRETACLCGRKQRWPSVFPPTMKRKSCSFSVSLSSSEEPTATHFILWQTWTKARFNLTCPQLVLSAKLARKQWRSERLETKRIASLLSWHAQETVPNWNRWSFSSARPCPKLRTDMALLSLCRRKDGWMKTSWNFGSRKYGDHESEDLEGEGVFLCLILSKPTRPSKSSVRLKTRTQIWQ